MVLEGRTYVSNRLTGIKTVEFPSDGMKFTQVLEKCLIEVCKLLDIPAPMWFEKNTHEFAAFHQTIFFADQYTEDVKFDKFIIKMLES